MPHPFDARLGALQVVLPARIGDPDGPSRGAAYGPRWSRTGPGLFVPVGRAMTPEQRIVECATPPPAHSAVTGWAALRLLGASYFAGEREPVAVAVPAHSHPRTRTGVRWVHRAQSEGADAVLGLPVAPAAGALLDHVIGQIDRGRHREAVVAVDMAAAAEVCSLASMTAHVRARSRVRHRADVERVLALAREGSASPPESRLRLCWVLDGELPSPLLNVWVHDRAGQPCAVPDLLEPHSGLVAEYDGAEHADLRRRARDAEKDDLYRELGLEPVRVTAHDMRSPSRVVDRLRRAYARALTSTRPREFSVGAPFTRTPLRRPGLTA